MKIINRPWYNQRNNVHNPSGTCFPTALACMLSPFVDESKYAGKQLEDWFWEIANDGPGRDFAETLSYASWLHGDSPSRFDFFANKCLNTVWDIQKFVGNYVQNTMKLNWTENGEITNIINCINNNSPVIVQLSKTQNNPIDHIICIIGYDDESNFIVMDSWGSALDDYVTQVGDKVKYGFDWLMARIAGSHVRMMWGEF